MLFCELVSLIVFLVAMSCDASCVSDMSLLGDQWEYQCILQDLLHSEKFDIPLRRLLVTRILCPGDEVVPPPIPRICSCSSLSYVKEEENDLGVSDLKHVCSQIANLVVRVGLDGAQFVLSDYLGLNRFDVLELFQKLEPQGWFCEWNEVYEME